MKAKFVVLHLIVAGLVFIPANASAVALFGSLFKRPALEQYVSPDLEKDCTASNIAPAKCEAMKECVLDSMSIGDGDYLALTSLMGNARNDTVNGKKMEYFTIKMFDPKRPEYRKIYLKWKGKITPAIGGNLDEQSNEYISFINTCSRRNGFSISESYTFLPGVQ